MYESIKSMNKSTSNSTNNRIPLTRAHLYTDDAPRLVQ
jgi:hypothetical protein